MNIAEAFFLGPWSSPWFAGNTLDFIGLLLTSSLGAAIAFRGGSFNLGGEGQIYLGGLAASAVLLMFPSGSGVPILYLAAFAAILTGGLMGFTSGFLKTKFGANELITSFLLSASLIPVADFLIESVWRDQSGNLLAMPPFADNRILPRLLPPSNLSISFIISLLLISCGYFFINRTVWGYRFRISGAAPDFAAYGGLEPQKNNIPAMSVSGALFGLAGFFAVAGTYGRCHLGFPGGLGWSAIAVALIARNRPLALVPAALVYGWLISGSNNAMLNAGMKLDASSFILAAALLLSGIKILRRQ